MNPYIKVQNHNFDSYSNSIATSMVQQSKKPYLDKSYYKMKDILHHAHMKNTKSRMRKTEPNSKNIVFDRQTKSV